MFKDFRNILDRLKNDKPEKEHASVPDARGIFQAEKKLKKTVIITVVNQKGGCGKTTTAVNLSACLAQKGYSTLLVDLDPQANASLGIGVAVDELQHSVYDVFSKNTQLDKVILPTAIKGLDIAPATSLLSGLQFELVDCLGREGVFKTALRKMLHTGNRHYDYILIDCSPALNIITINALVACNYVLIPVQTHYYSLEGMKELFSTISVVKERLNFELENIGIVATLFDSRTNINKEMLGQIKDYFKSILFDTVINMNVKLCEAPIYKKPITTYDPRSRGAQDYERLAEELLAR